MYFISEEAAGLIGVKWEKGKPVELTARQVWFLRELGYELILDDKQFKR